VSSILRHLVTKHTAPTILGARLVEVQAGTKREARRAPCLPPGERVYGLLISDPLMKMLSRIESPTPLGSSELALSVPSSYDDLDAIDLSARRYHREEIATAEDLDQHGDRRAAP
jgi:hypothetical protein